jgi:hypothetical protein
MRASRSVAPFAAAVKLIRRREIVDGQGIGVPAGGGERIEDRALDTVAPPVGVRRARVTAVHGYTVLADS